MGLSKRKTAQKSATRSRTPNNGDGVSKTAPKSKTVKKSASKSVTKSASKSTEKLTEYRQKRDFSKTAEPSGAKSHTKRAPKLRFVIQKHAASRLHFDLRLELDGVMKSWAVPKGPSADPSVKRLAMQVEDHPIEYNTFEGTIPKGEYGGGTVMLWDSGTYHPDVIIKPSAGQTERKDESDEDIARSGFERGDFKVSFDGKRIKGSYALVRTKGGFGGSSSKPSWLLIKHRDDFAIDASSETDLTDRYTTSVTTGRSMDKITTDG